EAFEAAHDGPDRDAVHAAEPPEHAAMEQLPLDELLHLAGVAVGEGPALRHGYAAVVRAASTTAGSMRMPGPIVDDVAIDLMSAPASSASRAASPVAKTATRTAFPVPWGSDTVPRII